MASRPRTEGLAPWLSLASGGTPARQPSLAAGASAIAVAPAHVEVRLVPGMGRGVFAAAAIADGQEIGRFHTIRIPPEEVRTLAGCTLSNYWFEDDADGAAFVVLGFIELVNHSRTPNLDRRWEPTPAGEVVTLFAIRDIAPGEQLFFDYRFEGEPTDPDWA